MEQKDERVSNGLEEMLSEPIQSDEPKVEPEKPKADQRAASPSVIAIDQKTQQLIARDNSELYRIIQVMMKGMAFPKTLDSIEKVIAAWQVAASLKIPPAIAMQNMAIIQGSVCIWGQLPKALAEATGQLEDFKMILFDENQDVICLENKNLNHDVWGSVCQTKKKGRSMNEYSFTMKDADKAGLSKKSGPWRDYPKIMLSRRAMNHAMKFEFPEALMGVPVAEYDFNAAPDLKDVTPSTGHDFESAKEKINQILKS
jgi:hypothetical protein